MVEWVVEGGVLCLAGRLQGRLGCDAVPQPSARPLKQQRRLSHARVRRVAAP